MAYCTPDDVFALALPAAAFVSRARPVQPSDVDAATGRIRLRAHGLSDDDVITFEVVAGGALPSGVSAFTPYTPTVISFDLFHIGIAPFASVGSGWGVLVDPLRRLVKIAEEVSAQIDEMLTAHAAPLASPPTVVVGVAARMTARAAVTSLQMENPAHKVAVDRLFAQEEWDKLILGKWLEGKPVQPDPADQTTDSADNGARVASGLPTNPDWMGRLP